MLLPSRIKRYSPYCARMRGISHVSFERKRSSNLSTERSRQKPRHPVLLADHALEECPVLSPETAAPPRLACRGGRLRIDIVSSYAPGVDATEDDGCGFYLLRDIIPDHGVDHRTQFHVLDDTKLLTTGPKILSHHFNIVFHRSVVFERVVLDDSLCVQAQHVLHGNEKVLLQAYSIGPSVET